MKNQQPNPLPCGCAVYGTQKIDTMGTKTYYTDHYVKHCEFHANARAREQALVAALDFAIDRLNQVAEQADDFHQKQDEAFDKWLKSRRGGKPVPAAALPIAASEMRSIATYLSAALAAAGEAVKPLKQKKQRNFNRRI